MPEVTIQIGGRKFAVACQEGEEHYLHAAASMLDAEAQVLVSQIGRMPEDRVLLMSGLMLADKTAGLEDKLRAAEAELAGLRAEAARLRDAGSAPAPAAAPQGEPLPEGFSQILADLALRAEALAARAEAAQD